MPGIVLEDQLLHTLSPSTLELPAGLPLLRCQRMVLSAHSSIPAALGAALLRLQLCLHPLGLFLLPTAGAGLVWAVNNMGRMVSH